MSYILNDNVFHEICAWANEKPKTLMNETLTNSIEKAWGNNMINSKDNNQWTTKLGESFVFTLLQKLNENPRIPSAKSKYRPDIETDEYIYEVKTRNWTTPGTAGEKVYGSPYKYAEIPELYNKPLKIVCVAFQEYELTHGATPIFDNVRKLHKEILDFYKSKNIHFIKCTDLINQYYKSIA